MYIIQYITMLQGYIEVLLQCTQLDNRYMYLPLPYTHTHTHAHTHAHTHNNNNNNNNNSNSPVSNSAIHLVPMQT